MVEETKQEELAEVLGGNEEKQNPNSQARRYMMTINNPLETDEWYIEHLEHF